VSLTCRTETDEVSQSIQKALALQLQFKTSIEQMMAALAVGIDFGLHGNYGVRFQVQHTLTTAVAAALPTHTNYGVLPVAADLAVPSAGGAGHDCHGGGAGEGSGYYGGTATVVVQVRVRVITVHDCHGGGTGEGRARLGFGFGFGFGLLRWRCRHAHY
jgi:hypothetical protein